MAHDFNNKLMTILGYGQLCQMELHEDDPLREYVDGIVEAAHRSAALTRQLLAFARKQAIQPEVLDLNDTVHSMLKMLQRLIGENIRLVWRPGASLWLVEMDPAQLDQILAHLAVNARDAIAGPGTLTVETANQTVDRAYAETHADAEPGEYVTLTVSDDGCGMAEEVLERLSEPFFTTKGVGKGTGLGLATIYGITRQNGGFITVCSEPGKGSSFRVHLPRCKEEAAGKNETFRQDAELPTVADKTVLLVEDEEALLKSTSQMLARLGYRVLAAPSARQALALAEAGSEHIDLLLTDVVMPETNGRELRDQMLAARPSIRCVFMSGYSTDILAPEGVLEEGVHFLQKPFTLLELDSKLKEAFRAER